MNKWIGLGRLTRDPETRFSAGGVQFTKFDLAVDKRKSGGQKEAVFIPVVAFGKLAEIAEAHLKKGKQIAVVGEISISKWQDDQGNNRTKTEILASEIIFTGSKSDSNHSDTSETGGDWDPDIPF